MLVVAKQKLNQIHAKLDWQLRRNERLFQVAVQSWFAFTVKQIQENLRNKFRKDITSELTDWKYLEEQGQKILRPATLSIMQTGGDQAYKLLHISGAFDVVNVGAIKAADKFCADLVKQVNNETKAGIRTYISTGIKEGKSMDKLARELRPLVGLTERQTESVSNYRTLLREQGISTSEIDSKATKYANKTHRRRTEVIARTETARAQNLGYVEGLAEVGVVEVEFSPFPGCCPICEGMDKNKYNVGETKDVIPVHPNCRCAMLPVVEGGTVSKPLGEAPANSEELQQAPEGFPTWKDYLSEHVEEKNTSAILYDYYKLKYQALDQISPSGLKHLTTNAKRFEATSVQINKPIPGFPTAKPSIKPAVVTPKPVEIPTEVLPKSYCNEVTDWDKRLVAHKADLKERLGLDLETLNLGDLSTAANKEALTKFEAALKSYTKPIENFDLARKNLRVYTPERKLAAKAVRNVNQFYSQVESIACDDFIKVYGSERIHVVVRSTREVGYKFRAHAVVAEGKVVLSETADLTTYFHELGHLIGRNKAAKLKAYNWIAARGGGYSKKMPYNKIVSWSKDTEFAFKDKFIDPYVGKVYRSGSSEALSMGMQQFTSYKRMLRFAKKDFDHFAFVHGVLTGAI